MEPIVLEVTKDLRTAIAQLGEDAHKPLSLNPHASFIRLKKTQIDRVVTIYMGTNCDIYWSVGLDYKSPGDDFYVSDVEKCELDFQDLDELKKIVRALITTLGYACVMTYSSDGVYQYPRRYYKGIDQIPEKRVPGEDWSNMATKDLHLKPVTRTNPPEAVWHIYTLSFDINKRKSEVDSESIPKKSK